jgi:PAS domain S-box-containing protein
MAEREDETQGTIALESTQLVAARIAEQRYRTLAESMPMLVWTTLPDGRADYLNGRFLSYLGLTGEQLPLAELDSVVHPSDLPRVREAWQNSLQHAAPFELEYRLRRADGVYHWFLMRSVPTYDEGSALTRWVGSGIDIDERKRSEQMQRFFAEAGALIASSRNYLLTLEEIARLSVPTLGDACIIDLLDADGTLHSGAVSSQDAAAQLEIRQLWLDGTAHTRGELSRHAIETRSALLHQPGAAQLFDDDQPLAWLIVPMLAHHHVLGSITLLSFRAGMTFDAPDVEAAQELGRRVAGVVESARLLELARLEKRRAEDASRAKDLFLGTLSHELRTPLSAILGWTRMLQSGSLPEDKRERALDTIERNARMQVAMIEDILDLARITSGKLRLDVAPVEIAQVVEAALDTIRPTAEAKGVRLQAVLDPDAGVLHGDGPRLQQIVWNLLSNAVKFTPKGGRVYVLLRRADSSVEVVVSDTGIGVQPEFLPRVFERFTQADSTHTRQHSGLGLGLSIVKHLAELHGGTVAAESAGSGQGATFSVRLPLAPLRDTPLPSTRLSTPARRDELLCPPELAGLHVLVVDDEADARELVQSVLETCKARVTLAGSAAEALRKLQDERPQVLVSDIGMPEEDGYSLIRKVRSLPVERGGAVPAVALTAYAHLSDRTRALMEGFNNHVSKPAEPQELIAVVAAVAGRHGRMLRSD